MRFPEAQEGFRATMLSQAQNLEVEVTNVDGPLITLTTFWHGEQTGVRNLYRGVFAVSGGIDEGVFEMDFDTEIIDDLFPLKIGNTVDFTGNTLFVKSGEVLDTIVHIAVIEETKLIVDQENEPVFVLEVITEFVEKTTSELFHRTVYYSPKYGLILKQILKTETQSIYWHVTKIHDDGKSITRQPKPKRRSDTLLI